MKKTHSNMYPSIQKNQHELYSIYAQYTIPKDTIVRLRIAQNLNTHISKSMCFSLRQMTTMIIQNMKDL